MEALGRSVQQQLITTAPTVCSVYLSETVRVAELAASEEVASVPRI